MLRQWIWARLGDRRLDLQALGIIDKAATSSYQCKDFDKVRRGLLAVATTGGVPTADKLLQMGYTDTDKCQFCRKPDSAEHSFMHCPFGWETHAKHSLVLSKLPSRMLQPLLRSHGILLDAGFRAKFE